MHKNIAIPSVMKNVNQGKTKKMGNVTHVINSKNVICLKTTQNKTKPANIMLFITCKFYVMVICMYECYVYVIHIKMLYILKGLISDLLKDCQHILLFSCVYKK